MIACTAKGWTEGQRKEMKRLKRAAALYPHR